MSENDHLKRLNEISSAVSERDLKIWENVAHSVCIKKQTESLQKEIARMKTATVQKKKENKMIERQLEELGTSLAIQRETLQRSEQSVNIEKAFRDSLSREANDCRKKYSQILKMYDDELQAYRSIYENASQGYKDLEGLRTGLKMLEIKNMFLDANISSTVKGQQQYEKIQEDIFHKTVIKFAEFFTLYHKREKMRTQLQEKRKEEQQLMKEHLRLADAVKQKKRVQLNKIKTVNNSEKKDETPLGQTPKASEEKTETNIEKLQKFLNEDIPSCRLTSLPSSQRLMNFNQNKSKVKILDMKVVKPLPPRPTLSKKPNVDLKKRMESIMQAAKEEAKRSNSFQLSHVEAQRSHGNSQNKKTPTPSGSQSQKSDQRGESRPLSSQEARKRPLQNPQMPGQEVRKNLTVSGSQESKRNDNASEKMDLDEPSAKKAPQELNSSALEAAKTRSKEAMINSILKPSSQASDKSEKQENVSKFFNARKKSVTFQNDANKEANKFQLSSLDEKTAQAGAVVKNTDIFQKPFFFKKEALQKYDEKNKKGAAMPEAAYKAESNCLKDVGTSESTGANVSFTLESAPTTFGTYADDTNEKNNEMTFDLETSFNCDFRNPPENFAPAVENPTFNFFGSQSKSNNPFSFF